MLKTILTAVMLVAIFMLAISAKADAKTNYAYTNRSPHASSWVKPPFAAPTQTAKKRIGSHKRKKFARHISRSTERLRARRVGRVGDHLPSRSRHATHNMMRRDVVRDANGVPVMPAPLVEKVAEIVKTCGSEVVSLFRPGSRVRGSGRLSNHALNKAADLKGNPKCIYDLLKDWPGGYSTDYARVNHVHISYNRNKEWGARFVHWRPSTRTYAAKRRHIRVAYR